jgi:hypothetical protein
MDILGGHRGMAKSSYQQVLPDGEVVHLFYFRNVQLWELSAEMLKQPGLEGMLPLLPLTKDGAEHQAIEDMIASLSDAGKQDLLPFAYTFAALVLDSEAERDWLRKRFNMLKDVLEESWAYQEMVQQGLQQGLKEGELRALRQTIVDVVQERFPEIAALTKKRVDAIEDLALLRRLNLKVSTAQTIQEAEQSLTALDENGKTN